MQRDRSIHQDLLAQVASSDHEAREVRRSLGAETTAGMRNLNAPQLKRGKLSEADFIPIIGGALRRQGTHGDRFARGMARPEPNAAGIAGPVITPCSGWGRMVQAVKRWLRGAR